MVAPLVSVIIPTFNRADCLQRALRSVFAQSFRDYEVLVVDDGSTDGTVEAVAQLPVRYLWQPHRGAAAARNRGIEESRGKYIAFLDSDDEWLPGKLAQQVAVMEQYTDVGLSYTHYGVRDPDGRQSFISCPRSYRWPAMLFHCRIAMPTVMLRWSMLDGRRFIEGIHGNDDLIMWARMAAYHSLLCVPDPLAIVYARPNQNARDAKAQVQACRNIIEYGIKPNEDLLPVDKALLLVYWNVKEKVLQHVG